MNTLDLSSIICYFYFYNNLIGRFPVSMFSLLVAPSHLYICPKLWSTPVRPLDELLPSSCVLSEDYFLTLHLNHIYFNLYLQTLQNDSQILFSSKIPCLE